ncbi:MAG: HEAT repeat domain-containing protein [Bdellovibrionales bacterium]|nr:HEAT repeat domain-containing protein [Bdellovibrionales bacterium]
MADRRNFINRSGFVPFEGNSSFHPNSENRPKLPSQEEIADSKALAQEIIDAKSSKELVSAAKKAREQASIKSEILKAIFAKLTLIDESIPEGLDKPSTLLTCEARKELKQTALHCCKPLEHCIQISLQKQISSGSRLCKNIALDCLLDNGVWESRLQFTSFQIIDTCKKSLVDIINQSQQIKSNSGTVQKLLEVIFRREEASAMNARLFKAVWHKSSSQTERHSVDDDNSPEIRRTAASYAVFCDHLEGSSISKNLDLFCNFEDLQTALSLLIDAGNFNSIHREQLVEILNSGSDKVKSLAVQALGNCGKEAAFSVHLIKDLLESSLDNSLRAECYKALAKIGEPRSQIRNLLISHWDAILSHFNECEADQIDSGIYIELKYLATGIACLSSKDRKCKQLINSNLTKQPSSVLAAILAGIALSGNSAAYKSQLKKLELHRETVIRKRVAMCYYAMGKKGLKSLERLFSQESNHSNKTYIASKLPELRSLD